MEELNLNIASEYLIMAAELLEMKSNMLLPHPKLEEDVEEEDPREELKVQDLLDIEIKEEKQKFDIKTFEPFDKVLVRNDHTDNWKAGFLDPYRLDFFVTTDDSIYKCCVPYNEETKHLHGKSDEAPEYYQVWKK